MVRTNLKKLIWCGALQSQALLTLLVLWAIDSLILIWVATYRERVAEEITGSTARALLSSFSLATLPVSGNFKDDPRLSILWATRIEPEDLHRFLDRSSESLRYYFKESNYSRYCWFAVEYAIIVGQNHFEDSLIVCYFWNIDWSAHTKALINFVKEKASSFCFRHTWHCHDRPYHFYFRVNLPIFCSISSLLLYAASMITISRCCLADCFRLIVDSTSCSLQ